MDSEQEWRQFMLGEIKEIRNDLKEVKSEMMTLKIKVAIFSSLVGSVASFIAQIILK